jgi:hypothetical protein
MNPSASGWISKFGSLSNEYSNCYANFDSLYQDLLVNGFIYGIHLAVPSFIEREHELSEDEVAKINLLSALYYSYRFDTEKDSFEDFVDTVFDYYNTLDLGKISFLNKILTRIYLNGNIFNRAFGNSLTNSLLFIDVLLFRAYLTKRSNLIKHAQLLEYITVNIAYQALNSKEASKSDVKLIQLLASSLTYIDAETTNFNGSYIEMLLANFTDCEKKYLLDIACLTVWEDHSLDYTESEYIYGLGKDLKWDEKLVKKALENVRFFFDKNREKIPYLKDTNLASKFYDGMTKNVSKIILRNSKRLKKELSESKELVLLLTKSTTQELNEEERKKIQSQLIDIFKSIPSLAIFILPGGAVLLPIFIKLIPKLLPSAFDDNRIEENS